MPFVHLVIVAALIEYLWVAFAVGKAREQYGVKAPATTGNEIFERNFRVQMNTLEQLIIFIPSILMFAYYFDARIAAALGAVFVIGRIVYFRAYVRDPRSRSLGFALSFVPMILLLAGALLGAALALR
ncbi:MAG TPA: MAPEG family protein [Steroidobacteraceae bacterium]